MENVQMIKIFVSFGFWFPISHLYKIREFFQDKESIALFYVRIGKVDVFREERFKLSSAPLGLHLTDGSTLELF